MSITNDHADFRPPSQLVGPTLLDITAQHITNYFKWGPVYAADWAAIGMLIFPGGSTFNYVLDIKWYLDAALTKLSGSYEYQIGAATPLSDVLPVLGAYFTIEATAIGVGDSQNITFRVYARNSADRLARSLADGVICSVPNQVIGPGAFVTNFAGFMAPGRAMLAVYSSAPTWSMNCSLINDLFGNKVVAHADSTAFPGGCTLPIIMPPYPLAISLANTGAGNISAEATLFSAWGD